MYADLCINIICWSPEAMRLYLCWDASREVRTDGSATETDIRRSGNLQNEDAVTMLLPC